MSLTVHCAQCHNHKFDPISQEDYYRLQAVFAAIDRADRPTIATRRSRRSVRRWKRNARPLREKIALDAAEARRRPAATSRPIETQIAEASTARDGPKPPEYRLPLRALPEARTTTKWVQVDLGESVKLDRIVLRPLPRRVQQHRRRLRLPGALQDRASNDSTLRDGCGRARRRDGGRRSRTPACRPSPRRPAASRHAMSA